MTNLVKLFVLATLCMVLGVAHVSPVQAATGEESTAVMVLPFEINAGQDYDYLNADLPELITQRLAAKGIAVIPQSDVNIIMQKQGVKDLDIATARSLALLGQAAYSVYGSFTQLGDAFSIDMRVVDASGTKAVKPYFIQKEGMINLLPAVDEVVSVIVSEFTFGNTIAKVEVRGTKVLDSDVVLMRLSSRKGDTVDLAAINREIKRIWDLGYFSDVQATIEESGEGKVLVYTVQEKPRIANIVIQGSDEIDEEDILSAMNSKTGSVLNEKLLAQDLQAVTELYRKDGFYLAKVTHELSTSSSTGAATLILNVQEGNKLYIQKINIKGLEALDEDELKDLLGLQEEGFFSWFTNSGILKDELLERDSAAISAYCLNRGYIDVQVSAPEVSYAEEGITIDFVVKEGKRYKIGEVKLAGDLIDTDERLYGLIKLDDLKEGDGYFSLEVMQADDTKLTNFYSDYGYAFADINAKTAKHAEDGIIDITYEAVKRQKVFIHRVVIEGNARTRDNVILREMRLTDGDEFNGAKLRRSNERLNRTRYFSAVDMQLVPLENPAEVDLKVRVKEDNTGAISGGVGYSTYYDFGVSASIMERNLFGRGYVASLQGFLSGTTTSLMASFVNPRVNDGNMSLGYDIYAVRTYYDDYSKNTYGNTVRFGYPVGEYSSIGWGYRLDFYTLYDIDEDSADIIKEREGHNISSVLHGRFFRDTTDSVSMPTKGTTFRFTTEYGGSFLGGDDNFIKPVLEYQIYQGLMKNHTLHFRTKWGAVLENTDEAVPVFERFYMGGIDSVRGYDSSDISPREASSGDTIGGDRMAFMNFEYIWTFEEDLGLSLVPFFDIGVNYDSQDYESYSDEIKRSYGLELRWRSPMGDLRFAYGIPLDDGRDGESLNGRFEFTMGQFF
ncbi:MAG: outer membrane protein assembly factor BamA [Pseudomonadota bacterium]